MTGIGHNSRREPGTGWRRHCWREARAALLPALPLEIVRIRVRRAQELGLSYRTYATVRATAGRDVIALLFSSHALRVLRAGEDVPPDRASRLSALKDCDRLAFAQPPVPPERLGAAMARAGVPLAACAAAPDAFAPWSEAARAIRALIGRLPSDGVLLVGETALEREWCAAGRLAGWVPADAYFAVS